jgi:DedD protein
VAKAEHKAEPKPERKADTKPEPKAETKLVKTNGNDDDAARALAILEGKAPPKVAKPEAADKSSFVVQVAVLSTQEKVDELQAKLKSGGIKSYTQRYQPPLAIKPVSASVRLNPETKQKKCAPN